MAGLSGGIGLMEVFELVEVLSSGAIVEVTSDKGGERLVVSQDG